MNKRKVLSMLMAICLVAGAMTMSGATPIMAAATTTPAATSELEVMPQWWQEAAAYSAAGAVSGAVTGGYAGAGSLSWSLPGTVAGAATGAAVGGAVGAVGGFLGYVAYSAVMSFKSPPISEHAMQAIPATVFDH